MKKLFRIWHIVVFTLAIAMVFTVAGNSSRMAAVSTGPSYTINQALNGVTYPPPGLVKPNVGWNT